MNRRWLFAGLSALVLVAVGGPIVATVTDETKPEQQVAPLDAASASADRFLEQRVQPSGIVGAAGEAPTARKQADGLLVAAAVGDRGRVGAIWLWTEGHLVSPQGGLVVAPGGSDADAGTWIDTVRGLLVAGQKLQDPDLTSKARSLARALAAEHVVMGPAQKAYLASSVSGAALLVTPSAHSPRAEAALAAAGDQFWTRVSTSERELVSSLEGPNGKARLVPDAATVGPDGSIVAASAPGANGPAYGRSAAALLPRLAESCDAADRAQAGRMWQLLSRSRDSRTSVDQTLDGKSRGSTESPIGAVAAAAGAHSVGAEDDALAMLQAAEHFTSDRSSTEDLAAVALGRIMLTTTWLGGC